MSYKQLPAFFFLPTDNPIFTTQSNHFSFNPLQPFTPILPPSSLNFPNFDLHNSTQINATSLISHPFSPTPLHFTFLSSSHQTLSISSHYSFQSYKQVSAYFFLPTNTPIFTTQRYPFSFNPLQFFTNILHLPSFLLTSIFTTQPKSMQHL